MFRKEAMIQPVYVCDGNKRLVLTLGGFETHEEEAPDGCVGDYLDD